MLPPKVFISYRHEDGREAADVLDSMFRRAGLETIRDTCFAEGEHLDEAVLRGLASADIVLLLVTPRWLAGKWVMRELRYVRAVGKRAVHVFLGEESSLKSIKDSPTFRDVWGKADDSKYTRYLEYFPWLTVTIRHANEMDRVLIPVLRALGRVPMVDWPRSNEFLPLRTDLPDKFLCLTEKGLSHAARDLMPGNAAIVTPTSRAFDLRGAVSSGLLRHLGVDPQELAREPQGSTRSQACGSGVVVPTTTEYEGRRFFLIRATAFAEGNEPRTSESLQRQAVRQALEVATIEYGCTAVVLPLFATGPHVGLPVHQGIRAVLSEICCFMGSHRGPLAVVVSVPTPGADPGARHIGHALNYVVSLGAQDVPQLLSTSIRFRLRGVRASQVWMSRSGTVRQLATQLQGVRPESLDPATRCYAWAGKEKVGPRGDHAHPYEYDLNTKVGDMVFCDGEIVSFEPETSAPPN